MYKIYLKEKDQLKNTDFPIIAHLNEAANSDFILFLQNLNNGTGSGYEFTCSNFWDALDEYDKSQIKNLKELKLEHKQMKKLFFHTTSYCTTLNL